MNILAFGPDDLSRIAIPLGILLGVIVVVAFGWKGLAANFKEGQEKGRKARAKLDEKLKPRDPKP